MLSRMASGSRISLVVGLSVGAISLFVGLFIGSMAGYFGGVVDEVIMRFNDIVLSIPWLVLMIVVAAIIGNIELVGMPQWSEEEQGYASSGTIVADAEEITPQDSQAFCANCEQDVTEAAAAYEASLSPPEEAAGV